MSSTLIEAEGGFTQLFVDFCHELRSEGLPVGSDDVMTLCSSVVELDPSDILDTYWAGRTTVVHRRDHIPVYDDVFRRFFLDEQIERQDDLRLTMRASKNTEGVLQVPDAEHIGSNEQENEEVVLGLQSSTIDVNRHKHFANCTPEELAALRRIMAAYRLTPPRRRSRRRRPDPRGRSIHVRRMVRDTMRHHGEMDHIVRSERRRRPRPLVLLLDVSGSMSDYSRNLLQFAYSTRRAAGRVEVFCFGTRITRITPQLDRRRPDDAINRAAAAVFDFDGGTRIGDCLSEFVRRWARRGIARGGIVVVCSDGLDRGRPETLATAMEQISRLSHRIVWMNPHVGNRTGQIPNSLGMMVAEPFIDEVLSGHNLASLEEFTRILPSLR
jgi:uncharacterized protein with von Willebrand factor type A (vWA) domain